MALDFFVHIPWFGDGLSHGFRNRSSQGQGCNLIGVDWLMSLYLLVCCCGYCLGLYGVFIIRDMTFDFSALVRFRFDGVPETQ